MSELINKESMRIVGVQAARVMAAAGTMHMLCQVFRDADREVRTADHSREVVGAQLDAIADALNIINDEYDRRWAFEVNGGETEAS